MGRSLDVESRKQISFDLKQDLLKKHYPNPKSSESKDRHKNAYKDIRRFFKKEGWEHRQGSVYASKEAVAHLSVLRMIDRLAHQMPWLHKCIEVNGIDITDIGENYSLYKDLQTSAATLQGIEEPNLDIELSAKHTSENAKSLTDIRNELPPKHVYSTPKVDLADSMRKLGAKER